MQYPYSDKTETMFDTFENEVRYRLQKIEEKLNEVCSNNDLVQELIRTELRRHTVSTPVAVAVSSGTNGTTNFVVTKYTDDQNVPVTFQVTGRTFDIRNQLKTFANTVFVKQTKGWEYTYDETVYNEVVEYLKTLTNDIQYKTQITQITETLP